MYLAVYVDQAGFRIRVPPTFYLPCAGIKDVGLMAHWELMLHDQGSERGGKGEEAE